MQINSLSDAASRLAELVDKLSEGVGGGVGASARSEVPPAVAQDFAQRVHGPAKTEQALQTDPAQTAAAGPDQMLPSPQELLARQFEVNFNDILAPDDHAGH